LVAPVTSKQCSCSPSRDKEETAVVPAVKFSKKAALALLLMLLLLLLLVLASLPARFPVKTAPDSVSAKALQSESNGTTYMQ